MKYTFTENVIGEQSETGNTIATRLIIRPIGVNRKDWLKIAAQTVKVLNEVTSNRNPRNENV